MAFISHEYRFLFYSAPATGSTAVITAFENRGIGEYFPLKDIVEGKRRLAPRKHSTPEQLEQTGLLTPEVRSYYHFVGIRNPFSFHVAKYLRNRTKRMKQIRNEDSWIHQLPEEDKERYIYNIKRQSEMSFPQFLRFNFRNVKEPQAIQAPFHVDIQRFVHQESINDDLALVCQEIGIEPAVEAERVNVTNAMPEDKSYRDYYDQESIDLVYRLNAPSFERFPEYDFDGYHPERLKCGSVIS